MTDITLIIGSFLIAFGPILSLFGLIVYKKAQLVILVTTSAFFYLLSATVSGLFWFILNAVGLNEPIMMIIIPSVISQFIFRCTFTSMYHKVEEVIQDSLERQQQNDENGQINSTDPVLNGRAEDDEDNHENSNAWTETIKLRLALNDASSALAGAVGFGGMHLIMLYGTLLASEAKNNIGILYQDSCPAIPSLVVSGILAALISILQIFWMLLTFFGVRRRLLYSRGEEASINIETRSWFGNSRNGGNAALISVLCTHLLAAFFTLANTFNNGCFISIPGVGFVVLLTAYIFYGGCARIYMPPTRELFHNNINRHRD